MDSPYFAHLNQLLKIADCVFSYSLSAILCFTVCNTFLDSSRLITCCCINLSYNWFRLLNNLFLFWLTSFENTWAYSLTLLLQYSHIFTASFFSGLQEHKTSQIVSVIPLSNFSLLSSLQFNFHTSGPLLKIRFSISITTNEWSDRVQADISIFNTWSAILGFTKK